jgi:hypothetical protein
MLKIKFKQYGVFKKHLNSSFNSLIKFFFNNDAGRIQNPLVSNKNAEKKPIPNNNLNNQTKLSDPKIRILNDRRAKSFLKEDEESFRKKQEFIEKDKVEKSDKEEDIDLEKEESLLNINQANRIVKTNQFNDKNFLGRSAEINGKELKTKDKNNVVLNNQDAEKKFEIEKNFKSKLFSIFQFENFKLLKKKIKNVINYNFFK